MSRIQTEVPVSAFLLMMLPCLAAGQAPEAEGLEPALNSEALVGMAPSSAESGPAASADGDMDMQSGAGDAVDEIELEVTEITGNQELPKMLYIVPWQASDAGDLVDKPASSALDNALAPIDRTEFIRQVDYYGDLHGVEAE
jgi:hypothetical protein